MKTISPTPGYAACFRDGCPRSAECLHYLYGQNIPEKRLLGPAIYPTTPLHGNGCLFFKTAQPKLMAWGFSTLFEDVRSRHVVPMRRAMQKYLKGRSNYYRYHRGELLLSPEQQQWISSLFQEYEYAGNILFDHYVEAYDFDH